MRRMPEPYLHLRRQPPAILRPLRHRFQTLQQRFNIFTRPYIVREFPCRRRLSVAVPMITSPGPRRSRLPQHPAATPSPARAACPPAAIMSRVSHGGQVELLEQSICIDTKPLAR